MYKEHTGIGAPSGPGIGPELSCRSRENGREHIQQQERSLSGARGGLRVQSYGGLASATRQLQIRAHTVLK
jgi:hypothetical protein